MNRSLYLLIGKKKNVQKESKLVLHVLEKQDLFFDSTRRRCKLVTSSARIVQNLQPSLSLYYYKVNVMVFSLEEKDLKGPSHPLDIV